jgi:hypothetical protein
LDRSELDELRPRSYDANQPDQGCSNAARTPLTTRSWTSASR